MLVKTQADRQELVTESMRMRMRIIITINYDQLLQLRTLFKSLGSFLVFLAITLQYIISRQSDANNGR